MHAPEPLPVTAAVEARGPSSAALLTIFKSLKTLEAHMEHPAFTGLGSGKRAVFQVSCPQQGGVARGRKASPKKRPSSLMQTHPSTDRVRGTWHIRWVGKKAKWRTLLGSHRGLSSETGGTVQAALRVTKSNSVLARPTACLL